ncbi:ORF21 protein [Ilyonectria robusta]
MVLKRKRSASELLSSPSSVSSFNSPPHGAAIRNPFATMDMTPIHLHSRTLKRFRDSRPSENEVHRKFYSWSPTRPFLNNHSHVLVERTLNMLYSAQHQPEQHDDTLLSLEEPRQTAQPEANQQSLHRFWNISSMPTPSPASMHPVTNPSSRDSGAGNSSGNGDEMDVDSMQCTGRQGVLNWPTLGVSIC